MEKTKVLCLILAIVLASAGTAGIVMGYGGDEGKPVIPDNAVNTVLDKPDEGTPLDRTAIENLYIAQGELQRKGSFVGTTRGSTTSAGIKQEVINNRVVVNGNVFKEMITIGVVKNAYQLFIYDGNYLYRKFDSIKSANNIKWANTASKFNEDDFLTKFGHRSNALTGYILNDSTILSGELEKQENGLFQYRYVLDINTAPARMLYEMKTNSNMNGYSTFVKAEIIVVMDGNWQVKTVSTDCKYKVPMFGGLDCVEDLTETFSDFEGDELPEKEFFKDYFNAEVEKPVEKDPDALSILMDMFSPYIGADKRLNASLVAANNGQQVLSGLVSAKIDVENLENIEVYAKIGDGLFVEYQKGGVYVTYQDFKASTTVDGIMDVVSAFMSQTDAVAQNDGEGDDDILSKFTYSVENGVCTVSLPLDLGEEKLEVNIYANVTEDGYQFTNANVTVGSFKLDVELASEFEMPERTGDYPEILGLLDVVKNGVIYGSVNAFGIDADVIFDLNKKSLYATSDSLPADLSVLYRNDAVYAEFGAIKAKLNVADIDGILMLLKVAGIVDGNVSLELPQISIEQILSLLGNIDAANTENGVKFTLDTEGLSVALYLAAYENGWNIDKITAEFDENVITLAVTAPAENEIPEIDDSQYADVMELIDTFINPIASLISASSYGASFDFDLTANNAIYNVNGTFAYDSDKNVSVNAVVSNGSAKLVNANVVVANGIVYVDVNGVKAAFAMGENDSDVDLEQIANSVHGVNDSVDGIIDAIYGIVDTVSNLDVKNIDFANLIKKFDFSNGKLSLTVNADFIGLEEIDVNLSVDNRNNLVVGLGGLNVADIGINGQAALLTNVRKVKLPNVSDYVLNLKGSVEDIQFAVSADLLNMDISASVNVFNQTVLVRMLDNKVYATVGEVALSASIDKIGALVNQIMAVIGAEGPSVDLGELADIDLSVETVLKAIAVDLNGTSLKVELKLDNFADVTVSFDNDAQLTDISASVLDYAINVQPTDTCVPKLDVEQIYIPVELLAGQILELYENYKNVLSTGLTVSADAVITINNVAYTLTANVGYNNGLYLNVIISEANGSKLVNLDMYLVNNVVYLDVNGVRVASELPENSDASNADVDVATVLGALSKAKGYNAVLDSVIEVAEQLPDRLQNLDYIALLTSLTYDDGTLYASVNGELLGLSAFDVTFAGTSDIIAAVKGLSIGGVTLDSVTVNAAPACAEISAPKSDYVTELEIVVKDYKVTAKLDLLNKTAVAKTTLLGHELGLYYANNVLYVSYGAVKAKLNVNDVSELIDVISSFIGGGIPSVEMPNIEVKEILNGLRKVANNNGYELNIAISGVDVTLKFNDDAKLTNAKVNVGGIDITATVISGGTYPSFDLNADYVDVLGLVNGFADEIHGLMNAQGYDVTLNGSFAFGNHVYTVDADVVYNGGLYVNAGVSYNAANLLKAELWLVDDTLYVLSGDLKLAIAVPQSNGAQKGGSSKLDLTPYLGYNPYVDGILKVVQSAIDKVTSNNVDYVALIDGLTFNNGELALLLNGEQLGMTLQSVKLTASNGLTANVNSLTVDRMTASFTANVKASSAAVTAPQGDFTTSLTVRVDANNTIYANLDLISGVYNFRINGTDDTTDTDDLFVTYSNGVFKIYKHNADGNDVYVSGNVSQIIDYVKQIDDLVNEFSGAAESTMAKIDLSKFSNVDIKAIVSSLAISSSNNVATVSLSAFGFDVKAMFGYGSLRTVTVPVSLIDKTLEVEPCAKQTFDKFDGEHDYIQVETVFNDYFPAFEKLVKTNSWAFYFDEETTLTLSGTTYKVDKGSYVEFYYKNTEGMDTFKLRANLDIYKLNGVTGGQYSWQPFMLVDAVYKDGSIYVTDTGRQVGSKDRNTIKLTVSVDTLVKCVGLYDELVEVVPQIGELVEKMMNAMAEAESNANKLSLSSIFSNLSYDNGVFDLVLNGNSLLSKLGEISLSAKTYVNGNETEGLYLKNLAFAYDGIELNLKGLRVVSSEIAAADYTYENRNDAKWQGGVQYKSVQEINKYSTEGFMDFNSLYELLSSFIITAKPVNGANTRSFDISGSVDVSLLGINVSIGLAMKVDIDADGNSFIAVKMIREKLGTLDLANAAFVDYGGDSYLYYDGANKLFTVYRNSYQKHTYCSICENYNCSNGWHTGWHKSSVTIDTEFYGHPDYMVEKITTEQFTSNIVQYILDLVNFKSWINDQILKSVNSENSNDFGIEDILKDYSYNSQTFKVSADLSSIDGSLDVLNLNILHDSDYSLTSLNGDIKLISICTAKLNLALNNPIYGKATDLVENSTIW